MKHSNVTETKYIGVPSRGCFCCLNCPEPLPEGEHPVRFRNIYEALHTGLKPCPVCQPDLQTDRIDLKTELSPMVNRAVELINEGYMNQHTVSELGAEIHVSERHLRRAFMQELGFSPGRLAAWHRTIFARHLLAETPISVTDAAFASGFGSVRQFNQVFREVYHTNPGELRSMRKTKDVEDLLYIEYEDGFEFRKCLDEIRHRCIPGIEAVTAEEYVTTFRINGTDGYVRVSDDPANHRLRLYIDADSKNCYLAVYHKIRRMFDISMDEASIRRELGTESFGGYLTKNEVPRLLLWFDPCECVHYSVIRQEMTHEQTVEILGKYAKQRGTVWPGLPEGLGYIYPDRISISYEDQTELGLSNTIGDTLRSLEQEIGRNKVALAYNQSYRAFRRSAMKLTGMTEPSVNYIAMFGLGMKNAYTYQTDWLISLNLEQWSNYRSYAALIYDRMEKESTNI